MQVDWCRTKVLGLLSKGDSQFEIAKVLQVDLSILSRDVCFLRKQAKSSIKRYIDERLPDKRSMEEQEEEADEATVNQVF